MAEALRHFIASRYGGRNVPVTLVLPDGARVPLSAAPAVEIVARSWNGMRALAKPALGSLARAYVRGDLDFTGSSQRMLAIAESMVGSVQHERDRARARVQGVAAPQARHAPEHRPPLRRVRRVLPAVAGRADGLFVRVLPPRRRFPRRGPGAEARPHLPQAAPRRRRAVPGHRLRLGRAAVPCGGTLRRRGHRHHAVAEPVRPRDAGNRRARPVRARARGVAQLPRPARRCAVRQGRERGHVRARRAAPVSGLFRQDPPRPEARRPRAQPRHHAQLGRPRRTWAAASAISSRTTSFPAGNSRTSPA